MALDTDRPRSRRAILAASLGGVAAAVAAALGRPGLSRATDGQPIISGVEPDYAHINGFGVNETKSTTAVFSTSGIGFKALSQTGDGLAGFSYAGVGVYGESGSASGVAGWSYEGVGVYGSSRASSKPAIIGQSTEDSTGVFGFSGNFFDTPPTVPPKTGVYGHADQDALSRGLWGYAGIGQGVRGETDGGVAVYGLAAAAGGYAFRGSGRVRFDRVCGVATIPAGSTSVTVTPGTDVTSESFVLLTPKANIGSRCLYVTTDATTNRFTIRMSSSRSSSTAIGWLLLR